MKKTTFSLFLALPLLFLLQLTNCAKEPLLTEGESQHPIPALLEENPDDDNGSNPGEVEEPCSGTRTFQVSHTSFITNLWAGYQLAVQLGVGDPILDMEEGCECYIDMYCITIAFPQAYVDGAAKISLVNGTPSITEFDIDGNGGYNTPFQAISGAGGNPQVHRICFEPDDLVMGLFSLPYGFPAGYDPQNAVITVEGICTIDNIPSPTG